MPKGWKVPLAAAALLCAGIAATGCGDDDGGGSGSAPAAETGTTGALSAQARAAIDAAYEGSFVAPPSTSPAPKRGLNVWFIPFSAELQDFDQPGWLKDAAKALGWKLTTFDGKFSPDTVVTGLRQAIADDADGIIMIAVDCAPIKAALQEVDRAGIPVVSDEAFDCNESKEGEPSLFDASVAYYDPENPDEPMTFPEFIKNSWGYTQGLGIIAGTEGEAKLVDVRETDLEATVFADDGIRQALKDHCPKCEIAETVEIVGTDLGAPLQQKVAQAFARNPDANAVVAPYDGATPNIAAAVQATGRKDEIWSQGGEGLPQALNLLKGKKGVDAGVGLSIQWELWAAADALNRLVNGEEPGPTGFPTGIGTVLFDREHNLPKGSRFEPPIDFKAAYLKAWGAG